MSKKGDRVSFRMLALGARFCYPGRDQVYVKIGPCSVAKWDPEQVATGWLGQGVNSASEDDGDFFVELAEN